MPLTRKRLRFRHQLLQNVPAGGEDDEGFDLPNIRSIFIPDEGYEMFDTDLSKADLRIVVWESGEDEMKAMLAEGRDPYMETAREFYKDPSLKKTRDDGTVNPIYTRSPKSFGHGTYYLGHCSWPCPEARAYLFTNRRRPRGGILGKYKKIADWQKRFCKEVAARRFVQNIFGHRRYYFGKVDEATMREAIAWLPQSTVALYINHIWERIYDNYPDIWALLQVHDSAGGAVPGVHEGGEALGEHQGGRADRAAV